MKRLFGIRLFANVTLTLLLVCSIVLLFGFGSTIYIARNGVERETDKNISQAVELVQTYVDGQLQRVEDVGYTLLSSKFASTVRSADGSAFVTMDRDRFVMPDEEEVFRLLEQFLNSNPQICGVAIGFEPGVYHETKGEYGFAAYVTNVSGRNERLPLGEIHDYRQKEWYTEAARSNSPYWSRPFAETSRGAVVACYSIPLHGIGDRLIGVLALDINTASFRDKCNEVTPFDGAMVSLVDREFNFISHPDQALILRNIREVGLYSDYEVPDSLRDKLRDHEEGHSIVNPGSAREALLYFAPIERTGWTISIECPTDEIYSEVSQMKRTTKWIGLLSLLFMIVCFWSLLRHVQKITASKAGIERDLEIASAIQMGMLPKLYPAFPDRDDVDIYGFLKPARTVGGDLYDYFIRSGKLFFCIGDVSGKGVPASLFMAVIRALFRNVSLHSDDPAEILSSLNTALSEGNTHSMFCTMFLGVLNLEDGHLDFCNAGHNPPVIRRAAKDGGVSVSFAQPKVNIAVGVFEGYPYATEHAVLNSGDAIFLYTDGVTEAENHGKEMFGEEAALKALSQAREHGARTAKEFVDSVYASIKAFSHGAEQSDDITMVAVEYKGSSAVGGTGTETVTETLHLRNSINEVPSLGDWLGAVASKAGLTEEKLFQLNLAMEEAVVNVMKYAYPDQEDMPVDISCTAADGELTFVIDDHGIPFDPTAAEAPDITLPADQRPIGGLGIMLVRQLMDSVSYSRVDGHNRLTLKMKI